MSAYFPKLVNPDREDAAFERMKKLIAASVPEFQLPPVEENLSSPRHPDRSCKLGISKKCCGATARSEHKSTNWPMPFWWRWVFIWRLAFRTNPIDRPVVRIGYRHRRTPLPKQSG